MPTPTGRLLVVFLRGAADHLSMTVPLDDPDYLDARPNIAIASADALDLDGRFGFHPAMPRLHERYRAGLLAPIIAVGNPAADRSHFVSQSLLERGSDGGNDSNNLGDGWLARHLNSRQSADDHPMRGITVGSNVDASLIGCGALGIGSLRSFGLSGANGVTDALVEALSQTHTDLHAVEAYAEQAIAAARAVAELPASNERNRTVAAFDDIATLFDADLGTQVITTNIDGWDTHTRMGNSQEGEMRDMLGGLDDLVGGIADRFDASGIDDVTTVVVTEFGRRVNENGSGGCDHGWGSAALAMGRAVRGGTVHGDWMGLTPDVVADSRGDIPMTTDYRDLLGDALEHALGGDPRVAFPDHVPTATGVFRAT
ncbi:MAG: hypothetical protein ACJAXA_001515 [Candidatus Aldehydirespiratoraceae bacterium]